MDTVRDRSAQDVFNDHLRKGKEGSVEDDLGRNYAEDVVVLTSRVCSMAMPVYVSSRNSCETNSQTLHSRTGQF